MPNASWGSAPLLVAVLMVCVGCAAEVPLGEAPEQGAPLPVAIVSRDAERDVPTMVWARRDQTLLRPAHDTPEAAARRYLVQHAALYRLSRADLDAAYVHRVHDIGRGGVIVFFRQRVAGLEVARNELKVLMTRDLALVALTGSLHERVDRAQAESGSQGVRAVFRYPPAEAVSGALGDLYGLSLAGGVQEVGTAIAGHSLFDLVPNDTGGRAGISLVTPAQVMPVYFPVAGRLVPAYSIELLARRAGDGSRQGYEYVLDASDGRVLHRRNRIVSDVYSYQVWADADGTPQDGPQEDYTPHPRGVPDGIEPAFVPPGFVAVDGLVHSDGRVDPWLPLGATKTAGNNVRAYADHYDPDGFTEGKDTQASVLPDTHDFHYEYVTRMGPLASESQKHAAVVQLFYTTNWLHDYFYSSGFDELAGNAQDDNYGRGGVGGDALRAEAQNLGPNALMRNNALTYVTPDGRPPVMEFYLWEVPEERSFTVSGNTYATGRAMFGAQDFEITSRLVLADDGTALKSDGCQPLQNDVEGAIVLADRGNCKYELKAANAQAANAAGVIIINNLANEKPPAMNEAEEPFDATIPTLSISYEDGRAIKGKLAIEPLDGTMTRISSAERDGTIDNAIVAHEWGHLLHLRLVECSSLQCIAQSEGWADFIALHMMVREGDTLDGAYGLASYSTQILGESAYYGIRRVPYSRDPAKNALRFRHVSDGQPLPGQHPLRESGVENSEVHNAGEIWASMLFDGYLALLEETRKANPRIASFSEARRRMADYMVAGMMLAPVDPTFTEQRDALLMAALAQEPRDMLLLAKAFAGRGAGTCAVSPSRDSIDFTGVEEGDELRPNMHFEVVPISDALRSCDADGVLDAEESGYVQVHITNSGPVALTGATLQVSVNTAALSFPQGTTFDVGEVLPFSSITMRVPFELEPSLTAPQEVAFEVALSHPSACQPRVNQRRFEKFNYDSVPSMRDTVEGPESTWRATMLEGDVKEAWRIVGVPPDNREHVWYAPDGEDFADTVLETPLLEIAAGERFRVTFKHRYSFAYQVEPLSGETYYWNGGVIELSRDKGETWEDVRAYTDPGYGGTISTETSNNLGGRLAYVAENPSWPSMETTTLDFGTSLRGESVKLRFRFGSAWYFEAHGWEIDDVAVEGTVNPPFLDIGNDKASCFPHADAGDDQTVFSGDAVLLDGSRSSAPSGGWLTFSWAQRRGLAVALQTVSLEGGSPGRPRFKAPVVTDDTLLTFELRASDGTFTSTDTVDVLVRPKPEADTLLVSGGGIVSCGATGSSLALAWPLGLLVGMLAAGWGRRNR